MRPNPFLPSAFCVLFLVFYGWNCKSPPGAREPGTSLSGSRLAVVGRYIKDGPGVELISSGAHARFLFRGRSCTLYLSLPQWLERSYLQYEIDGRYARRLQLQQRQNAYLVSADSEGEHTVTLYKTVEAQTGALFVDSIGGVGVRSLEPEQKPLIEFIGNSITCGAAADPSGIPCGTGYYHDQHNAYFAYGPRVARALGTDFLLSSISGIGIYRTWNRDSPTMPQLYPYTRLGAGESGRWNFSSFSPRIVSIALGTNDLSDGDRVNPRKPFDSAVFVSRYLAFVTQVRKYYPDAKIAVLSSPMFDGPKKAQLERCLLAVMTVLQAKSPREDIAHYFFRARRANGCTGHPSVADHELIAEELVPFFRTLLK